LRVREKEGRQIVRGQCAASQALHSVRWVRLRKKGVERNRRGDNLGTTQKRGGGVWVTGKREGGLAEASSMRKGVFESRDAKMVLRREREGKGARRWRHRTRSKRGEG